MFLINVIATGIRPQFLQLDNGLAQRSEADHIGEAMRITAMAPD
jgi:hypothetical protein